MLEQSSELYSDLFNIFLVIAVPLLMVLYAQSFNETNNVGQSVKDGTENEDQDSI